MKKGLKTTNIVIISVLVLATAGFFIYTSDYYSADESVLDIIGDNAENLTLKKDLIVFKPEEESDNGIGIVFYPGGKVEAIAYTPLMMDLADEGYTCVLMYMPLNLALFGVNYADMAFEEVPQIDSWYLMGHSLGGAMSSRYAKNNAEKLKALILLGSYSIYDLDIPILNIYGENDDVMNEKRIVHADVIVEIDGGNHAYFGNYGEQKGDGAATISRDEQQAITVRVINKFIQSN